MSVPSNFTSTSPTSHRSESPDLPSITPNESLFDAIESASEQNFPQRLQAALSNGADLQSANNEGKSVLECALERGSVAIACALISAGADTPDVGADGIDLLMQAAFDNFPSMVTLLADTANMSVDCVDATGQTALHYAVRGGSLQSVNVLLARGADCNAETTELSPQLRANIFDNEQFPAHGVTPLAMAIALNRPDIAQALIGHGAKLYTGSMNPLAVAIACNHATMVRLILERAAVTGETHHLMTQNALEIAAVCSPQTLILGQLLTCRQQYQLSHLDLRPLTALATKFNHTAHLKLLKAHSARAIPVRRTLNFGSEPSLQHTLPRTSEATLTSPGRHPAYEPVMVHKRKADEGAEHSPTKKPREAQLSESLS